jgi:hypothetical protein
MKPTALVMVVILAFAITAASQGKLSGSAKCAKPDKDHSIEVGDQPGHVFQIMHVVCTYSKGEFDGIRLKDEADTGFYEGTKDVAHGRFSGLINMANGDKVYISGESTMALKNGAPKGEQGKANFNGGTGKFKNIKGGGTFKVSFAADGTATVEVEGEYQISK